MKPIITSILILAASLLAQAEDSPAIPDPTETVHFTVELTDGSRLHGLPVNDGFPWKTAFGQLTFEWNRLKSVEKVGDGSRFSVVFRNGDHAGGTPEADDFTLRTLLGDLSVPLALTRRIGIEVLTHGSGPVAYWSFNDPANLGADDSGNGHPLTVKGAQSTEGRIGKAAATRENRENQGLAEYLITDNHPDLQFKGDFTLAVWAWRSAPFYDGDQLIAKEGEFSLRRYQFPTERYDVELFGKQGLSLAKVSETKSGLPLETWTLIVVSRKDDRLSIRVNDLPAVDAQVAPGETGGDKPLIIGSSATGYPWQGKIDEIKKWNRALAEEEQRELFRDPPAKPIE
jgi:Concanavalin A-like lectin/glucanases superfamily